MTTLYSYKGAYPYPLPNNMTGYDINDFTLAPDKPIISPSEKLEWDGTNWVVRSANSSELAIQWQAMKDQRKVLLQDSDIFVIRYTENGDPVPQDVKDYRQSLRDITTQSDPFNITWPAKPQTM